MSSVLASDGIQGGRAWLRLVAGAAAAYALFQVGAGLTRSTRGQAGIPVGALVVVAVLVAERRLVGGRLAWMVSSAIVPFLVFAVRPPPGRGEPARRRWGPGPRRGVAESPGARPAPTSRRSRS